MQRLEVSGAVRLMYRSLGVKGLTSVNMVARIFQWYCDHAAGYSSMNRGSFPARVRDSSLLQNIQTDLGPTQPHFQWVAGGFRPG